MNIRNTFNLTPKAKMLLAITVTVLVVGTLLAFGMGTAGPSQKRERAAKKPQVENVLTDEDPRALGIDALAAQIRQLQSAQTRLERTLGQREKDVKLEKTQAQVSGLEEELKMFRQELARVEREGGRRGGNDTGTSDQEDSVGSGSQAQVIPARTPSFVAKATDSPDTLSDVYSNLPSEPPVDPRSRSSEKQEAPKIRRITNQKEASKEDEEKDFSVSLPAGSILSGVIVTGMDAPTGRQAQREPFPSLIRIKTEAILPNRFRADFRECMLIAGGWGDLSSERAYMRSERLSCVRNDGTVLEAPIEAYASGEDGKTGIRGRLVSKQGQIIARSVMAGFAEGVASMFDVRQVPSINITRGSGQTESSVYEQAFDSNAIQGAGARGFGTAFERIANFYLELAENIFPVIEIDAMRDVDFIVNKGFTVKFNASTLKVADVN